MVLQYGSFGFTAARATAALDRTSLLRMSAPALADLVSSLDASLKTTQTALATRTQERDTAVGERNARTTERDQAVAAVNLRTQERDQARNERESFRQQAAKVPTLEKSVLDLSAVANLVPGLQQQIANLSQQASRIPALEQQAGRVPTLERQVTDLSLVAQQVPGLNQRLNAVVAERDGLATGLRQTNSALATEQEKSRNFERAASGLKMQADGLALDLANVNKVLAQVQASFEASQAEAAKLSQGLQSERSSRIAAEGTAEARAGELSVAKTALIEALAGKDLALADAAKQWKSELDSALKSARESLEAEREVAKSERNAVEEKRKDLGQRYEELLVKYNKVLAELEAERAKSCPVCPVCQDCPAPTPCPECGKASTQSASTEAGISPWTLLLAAGGGYLVAKSIGK